MCESQRLKTWSLLFSSETEAQQRFFRKIKNKKVVTFSKEERN
jgi:hypothetical protein